MLLALVISCTHPLSNHFTLPQRHNKAIHGRDLAQRIGEYPQQQREQRIMEEIVGGNIPDLLRQTATIRIDTILRGIRYVLEYEVMPDYLALGSNQNFLYIPLSAATAQRIADTLGCLLPTKKMVRDIYNAAVVKIPARPIPPSATMATMPVFMLHTEMIRRQQDSMVVPPIHHGVFYAGHKKDLVISPRLKNPETPDRVAIYGWFRENGSAIQPLSLVHRSDYADYSHGVRLVYPLARLNGKQQSLRDLLRDSVLCGLVSDEGVLRHERYCIPADSLVLPGYTQSRHFGEQERRYTTNGLQILINAPAPSQWLSCKPTNVVVYALPNGNTIEHTVGKILQPGEDWHYSIQHIGAQTRMLRSLHTSQNIVVVYLMAASKSLPLWRSKTPDSGTILQIVLNSLLQEFQVFHPFITLSGHSGGGSIIFSLLDYWETIPLSVRRITFLDSNYGYVDSSNQIPKLIQWLRRSPRHNLCVIAYDDRNIMLNGKPVLSPTGGTFRRTSEMIVSLQRYFSLQEAQTTDICRYRDSARQIDILLHTNPRNEIQHTVLVEKNGFIHALTTGTIWENKAGEFWGNVLYSPWIQR